MKTHRLNNIAQVITGFTFRKDTKKVGSSVLLLQSKNIGHSINIQDSYLDSISLDTTKIRSVLKSGDVLISSRGSFKSGVIESSNTIVATSSVFILRPTNNALNSEYLAIFLNSLNAQKQMTSLSTSGSIPSLLKSELENISIPLPSLKKQKTIVDLYLNIEKQKELLQRKMHLIGNIADGALSHQITHL